MSVSRIAYIRVQWRTWYFAEATHIAYFTFLARKAFCMFGQA